jgi:hypothetical protein
MHGFVAQGTFDHALLVARSAMRAIVLFVHEDGHVPHMAHARVDAVGLDVAKSVNLTGWHDREYIPDAGVVSSQPQNHQGESPEEGDPQIRTRS